MIPPQLSLDFRGIRDKFEIEKKIVIANLAERGNMTFSARLALSKSLCHTAVSKLVVWKANGNLLQGSDNCFKIAPPSSGRSSTSCKLPDNSVIDTSLG